MFTPPTVLGHECIAEIVKIDEKNSKFKKGDKVVVAPYIECGVCDKCLNGNPELCERKSYLSTGCFCEFISMDNFHASRALIKIDELDDVYTLTEPLACVINGIEKLNGKYSKNLIVGGGPMGMLFYLMFKILGKEALIVESTEWRREFLKEKDIKTISPDEKDTGEKYDNVILAVNKPELVNQYKENIKDGGIMLLFAGYPAGTLLEISAYDVHYREIIIKGSFGFAKKHFVSGLNFINKNKECFRNTITDTYKIEEGKQAFDIFKSGKSMKVVIRI